MVATGNNDHDYTLAPPIFICVKINLPKKNTKDCIKTATFLDQRLSPSYIRKRALLYQNCNLLVYIALIEVQIHISSAKIEIIMPRAYNSQGIRPQGTKYICQDMDMGLWAGGETISNIQNIPNRLSSSS
jgi:hypothetical protein